MLHLMVGASGTGKTGRILEQLRQRAAAGKPCLLLVPEQFTAGAETMVYTQLGDALCGQVEVYSFTSLAEEVLRRHGGVAVRTLNDAARVVTLRRAIDSLADALPSYRRHRRSTSFCALCADAIKELKIAGATPEFVLHTADSMGADGEKLRELGLIFGAYEGAIRQVAADPSDRISLAARRFSVEALRPYAVFVDQFDGFTAPEYDMLRSVVQAEECTVTLCCTELYDREDGLGLFGPVQRTGERLRRLAKQCGVEIAPPIVLRRDMRHANAPQLSRLNALLCAEEIQEPSEVRPEERSGEERFFLTFAQDRYDECKTVAAQIARLAGQGKAYRDIAVICRQMEPYAAPLEYELGLADIPYFSDETTTLEHAAPAAFVRAALALLARGIGSETVLRLLKTDLCGFAPEAVAAVENYAYTWQLRAADWRAPFTRNPGGLDAAILPEDAPVLAAAEGVRAAVMPKLEGFVEAARGADAYELTRQLYLLLVAFGGDAHTQAAAQELRGCGQPQEAEALCRAYNIMMSLLDEMTLLLGHDRVTPEEYDELFCLLLRASDIGHVPQTQNTVLVTAADRMRLAGPRYCFVLGAAEGEFPKTVGYSGLLSHADRELLVKNGLEMPGSFENRTLLEQMFFYRAMTAASEGVYVSCVAPQAGGAPLCAALTQAVRTLCPQKLALTLTQYASTPAAALDLLGLQYREDTPETAALEKALRQEPALEAMRRAASPKPFAAQDGAALAALLGRELYLTPTRVEQYYKCRFGYFLQYVLRLRPRKKAELTPLESGSFVHFILEQVMRAAGAEFASLSEEKLTGLAHSAADAYIEKHLPQAGARFGFLMERIRAGALQLLLYLQQEQAQSDFHPVAFEQPIGTEDGAVRPLTLRTPDGRTVHVVGTVDRVDVMERGGSRYVRVVDYKTGRKEFRLDLVYCGLDLQMLLYLFAVCDQTPGPDHPVASGVLYVLGDPAPESQPRAEAAQPIPYHVDGLVLDDAAVVRGMDRAGTGLFVPFRFTKSGAPCASQKLAALEKLGAIRARLEELVVQMAMGLYRGEIGATPLLTGTESPCTPCEYRAVCCHEDGVGETRVCMPRDAFSPKPADPAEQGALPGFENHEGGEGL